MSKRLIVMTMSLFCSYVVLDAYQPLEPDGLIGGMMATTPVYLKKSSHMRREKRKNGSTSRVIRINGREEFEQAVLASSTKRPVVLLVLSSTINEEARMQEVCHDVADMFKNVSFISMNLLDQRVGVSENSEIITHFMLAQNLTRLELPLVLFFKDGELYAPVHESAVILQGFYSKEYLAGFIRSKFFNVQSPIIDAHAQDLTRTPLHRDSAAVLNKNNEVASKQDMTKQDKPSLKQKILNFFKRK